MFVATVYCSSIEVDVAIFLIEPVIGPFSQVLMTGNIEASKIRWLAMCGTQKE